MALKRLSGATMLLTADKTRIPFRLNLASFAVGAAAHTTSSVHVSKLPEEYTDYLLEQKFRELCGSSGTSHVLIRGWGKGTIGIPRRRRKMNRKKTGIIFLRI